MCTTAALAGCATRLDFDHVSAGRHDDGGSIGGDARVADASAVDTKVGDASRSDATTKTDAGATAVDASAPAQSSPKDASVLGSDPSDASRPLDEASVDAGLGPDPALFSCKNVSPEPYFCDDFETYALLNHWDSVKWSPEKPVAGGSIEIDSRAFRAGQESLLVRTNEGLSVCDSCITALATLDLPVLQVPATLTVEFDLMVEQFDRVFGRRVSLLQVMWGTPAGGSSFHTVQLESGGSLRVGFVEYDYEPVPPGSTEVIFPEEADHGFVSIPTLPSWVHVKYTLQVEDLSGAGNVAAVKVDDVSVFGASPSFGLRSPASHMEIGVPWVDMSAFAKQDKSKSWTVRFDNVLVRSEPR